MSTSQVRTAVPVISCSKETISWFESHSIDHKYQIYSKIPVLPRLCLSNLELGWYQSDQPSRLSGHPAAKEQILIQKVEHVHFARTYQTAWIDFPFYCTINHKRIALYERQYRGNREFHFETSKHRGAGTGIIHNINTCWVLLESTADRCCTLRSIHLT